MTRRQWIRRLSGGIFAAAASSGLYATTVEPRWFDISRHTIRLPKLQAPLRVLHLADLHSSSSVPTELLIDAARAGIATKPDLICLTGDYISTLRQYDAEGLVRIFKMLSDTAPTFAVMGNHDCGSGRASRNSTQAIRSLLIQGGAQVLLNRSTTVQLANGAELALAGTGDLWHGLEFDPVSAFADVNPELPVVALIHNPDAKRMVQDHPWDLMLSGHTHGGQVRIPFVHPSWLPVQDSRYIAGLYRLPAGRQLYITRGVGSPKGIRFRCRPEISVLNLVPQVAA